VEIGGDGADDLAELELVEDGSFTDGGETDHEDLHLLLGEQPTEELPERKSHLLFLNANPMFSPTLCSGLSYNLHSWMLAHRNPQALDQIRSRLTTADRIVLGHDDPQIMTSPARMRSGADRVRERTTTWRLPMWPTCRHRLTEADPGRHAQALV
jgi:hypothetical protein